MSAEQPPKKSQAEEKDDLIARGEFFWTDKEGNIRRDLPEAAANLEPHEAREQLKEAVHELTAFETPKRDLAEKAGVADERQAMQGAEEKYLAAYKAYYTNNSWLARRAKDLVDTKEWRQLHGLKEQYDKTRIKYGNALESSVSDRLGRKHGSEDRHKRIADDLNKKHGTKKEYVEHAKERYNRLVRFNEVIKPAAEKQIQARVEALDSKGQVAFEKGFALLSRGNKALEERYGKTGARAVRAAAAATLIAGGAAAAGGFGVGALLAATGYGAYRFGRSFLASTVGAGAGVAGGELYGRTFGKRGQAKAKEAVKHVGRSGDSFAQGMGAYDLARLDITRGKHLVRATDENLAKRKNIARALTTFGVGGATAIELADLHIFQHLGEALHSAPAEVPPAPVTPPGNPDYLPSPAAPEAGAPLEASVTHISPPPESVAPPTMTGELDQEQIESMPVAPGAPAAVAPEQPMTGELDQEQLESMPAGASAPETTITVSADLGSPAEVLPDVPPAFDHDVAAYATPPSFEKLAVADILKSPDGTYPNISAEQRTDLLDHIREHGTGPKDAEPVGDFFARSENTPYPDKIVDGYGSFKVHLGETHIYRNENDHLVVFGGDQEAQRAVLTEYLRTNPNESVFKGELGSDGKLHPVAYVLSEGEPTPIGTGSPSPGFFARLFGSSGGGLAEGPKPGDLKTTVF